MGKHTVAGLTGMPIKGVNCISKYQSSVSAGDHPQSVDFHHFREHQHHHCRKQRKHQLPALQYNPSLHKRITSYLDTVVIPPPNTPSPRRCRLTPPPSFQ